MTALAATNAAGISVQRVSKTFPSSRGEVPALLDVTLAVEPGEFMCLVGPSGCGKSTLLKILAGLIEPTSGEVTFLANGSRPRTAMVFQEHSLFPWMTIADNVAFGLEVGGMAKHERRRRAEALLDQLGLGEFALRYPHELSGGMQQRASIARALLTEPQILLMDEPFSALDAQSKLVLQEELLRLWRERRQTIVYVTHDIEEAVVLGDRVLVMSGRPGLIVREVDVGLPRPRDLRGVRSPEVKAKAWDIWKLIEGQVRRNLHLPS